MKRELIIALLACCSLTLTAQNKVGSSVTGKPDVFGNTTTPLTKVTKPRSAKVTSRHVTLLSETTRKDMGKNILTCLPQVTYIQPQALMADLGLSRLLPARDRRAAARRYTNRMGISMPIEGLREQHDSSPFLKIYRTDFLT